MSRTEITIYLYAILDVVFLLTLKLQRYTHAGIATVCHDQSRALLNCDKRCRVL